MTACIHQLSKDGNALRGVCAALIAERDTMQIARDAMQSERDAMQAERDTALQQRDAFERKRDAMQAELDAAQRERDAAKAHAEKIAAELALAKRELRMRMHALYGRRSERMSDKDLGLFAAFIEVEKEKAAAEKAQEAEAIDITRVSAHTRKGKNGRGEIPAHLPRENVLHELKGDELKCPCCGKPRWCIGEEVSEQLDCVPATVKVIRITKKKYACPDCLKGVVLALPPPRAIEKCKAAPGMLATVAVSKYADHLPAYRQEGILQRAGLLIRRSTLCDWMRRVAEALAPLISLITRRGRGGPLCAELMARAEPLHRERRVVDRQQRMRTRPSRRGDRPQELALHRERGGRRHRRGDVHRDRLGPHARDRALGVPQGRARTHRHRHRGATARVAARHLGQGSSSTSLTAG